MARVTRCKPCGIRFYDESEKAVSCNRCEKREAAKAAKMKRLKAWIDHWKSEGTFRIQWAFIQLYYRNGCTLDECAEILGITAAEAKLERDIARQNAR